MHNWHIIDLIYIRQTTQNCFMLSQLIEVNISLMLLLMCEQIINYIHSIYKHLLQILDYHTNTMMCRISSYWHSQIRQSKALAIRTVSLSSCYNGASCNLEWIKEWLNAPSILDAVYINVSCLISVWPIWRSELYSHCWEFKQVFLLMWSQTVDIKLVNYKRYVAISEWVSII